MTAPFLARDPDRLTDDQLVVRCGRGDVAALEVLVARHQDAAYRYCWRVFRDHHAAEDATQEFFLRLFRHASHYEPRGHFTTWFYRVLTNLCFDALRKKRRRRAVQGVQIDPLACEGTELEPRTDDLDPTAGLRSEEARDAVHSALGALPVEVRKALELRELEGLHYREIGAVLDRSLNEVKVLLHRGRKLLARALAGTPVGREWAGEEDDEPPRPQGGRR